ncbi:ArsR/SmtB family transcription factor [Desertibaculum subflavum]|uniref:ArsR/SmtB family transcription factor n=1 Tax=Desertibaculum subflavum TaxID=2268458 RepID=UPI000E66837B
MDALLEALRAAAEPTRLRLLTVCAHGELTVTELTQILGQSQPRISRHLKLLCEAGLLQRHREGTSALFRVADHGTSAGLARILVDLVPVEDATLARDLERLEAVKVARAESAQAYFRANAAQWDRIRSLHVPEAEVERALLDLLGGRAFEDMLDIGTGTGRMLELFGGRIRHGVGIDLNREMLAVARANLERCQLRNCQVRLGDMYHLPFPPKSFDAVTVHQVLHFAEEPAAAIGEAARVLKPEGALALVDFLPHDLEYLREEHAHRRLGFSPDEVARWCHSAGLAVEDERVLKGNPLSVGVWRARPVGGAA